MTKVTILGQSEPSNLNKIEFKIWVLAVGTTSPHGINNLKPEETDEIVLVCRKYRGGNYDYMSIRVIGYWFPVLGHFNDGVV